MAKGARSARGIIVDFDLLRIKENLGAAPKASTVKAREDFIDQKFKRRLRRMSETVVANTTKVTATEQKTEDQPVAPPVVEEVEVQPVVPAKKKIAKTSE